METTERQTHTHTHTVLGQAKRGGPENGGEGDQKRVRVSR